MHVSSATKAQKMHSSFVARKICAANNTDHFTKNMANALLNE